MEDVCGVRVCVWGERVVCGGRGLCVGGEEVVWGEAGCMGGGGCVCQGEGFVCRGLTPPI